VEEYLSRAGPSVNNDDYLCLGLGWDGRRVLENKERLTNLGHIKQRIANF